MSGFLQTKQQIILYCIVNFIGQSNKTYQNGTSANGTRSPMRGTLSFYKLIKLQNYYDYYDYDYDYDYDIRFIKYRFLKSMFRLRGSKRSFAICKGSFAI